MSAAVYFSPVITPEKVLDMFRLVDKTLPGNIDRCDDCLTSFHSI